MMCKKPYTRHPTPADLKRGALFAPQPLPCGQCLHCRINKHREIKLRILLETIAHEQNTFLTLTYDDQNFPSDGQLHLEDLQKFWKKLRHKEIVGDFRYFAVGEYGRNGKRGINPHYHAAVFGIGPELQPIFQDVWRMGFTYVGDVTKDSASYIAGYTLKKLTKRGDKRLNGLRPEFFVSSKKNGGIGFKGIKKISERIKADPRIEKTVMRELRIGGYTLPLGRYLTEKLHQELGMETELKKDKEEYNQQLLEEIYKKEGIAMENLIETDAQKRKQQKKRHAIWQSQKRRELHQ